MHLTLLASRFRPTFLAALSVLGAATWAQSAPTVAPASDGNWLSQAQGDLVRLEYQFSKNGDGQWTAPNRSQSLRTRVDANGIEVFPRTATADESTRAWTLRLRTAGFGRSDSVQSLGRPTVSAEGPRIELDHDVLIEWFVNDERGIEQGWTIANRPAGDEPLVIELALSGDLTMRVESDALAGVFVDADGRARAKYTGLVAWDADGRELRTWMERGAAGVAVRVDDTDAAYPIIVDPLMATADWTAEPDIAGVLFGASVASAGDVNGDGYDDVIIGAPFFDNGITITGRAFAYYGSASGLSLTADWVAGTGQVLINFGESVAGAGDVDGDGYDDVVVGAPGDASIFPLTGRAFIYHGSATGLDTIAAWNELQPGLLFGTEYGYSVAGAGDVNGDGYADVIIGAPLFDGGQAFEGIAYVYHGAASGLGTTATWEVELNQAGAEFGHSVASAGDVDGDTYSDVIVSAWSFDNGETDEGRVFVYHGSMSGLSTSPSWTVESDQADAFFGGSVSTAGDVNGDGYSDVIVGASEYDNPQSREGRAFVYHGSMGGLNTTEAWSVDSNQNAANLGSGVSTAGDVNSDGYDDVVVGALAYTNGQAGEGRAFLYHGSAAGVLTTTAWTAESNVSGAQFGAAVASAGDVNGDGYADVIVGAPYDTNGQVLEGRAYVYYGYATPAATGVTINGLGGNPMCFMSEPVLIGEDWDSTVDNTVRAVPTFSFMIIRALPTSGIFLKGGELLVDPASALVHTVQEMATGPTTPYLLPVPSIPALAGITATAQVAVFGGGYTMCNAYTFTVGF